MRANQQQTWEQDESGATNSRDCYEKKHAEPLTRWNKLFVQRRGPEWNLMEEWVIEWGEKTSVLVGNKKWNSAPTWFLWHDHPGVWICLPPMANYTLKERETDIYITKTIEGCSHLSLNQCKLLLQKIKKSSQLKWITLILMMTKHMW